MVLKSPFQLYRNKFNRGACKFIGNERNRTEYLHSKQYEYIYINAFSAGYIAWLTLNNVKQQIKQMC